MKLELTINVYDGEDFVDHVCYVVSAEPLVRILEKIPDDHFDVSVDIVGLEVLYE